MFENEGLVKRNEELIDEVRMSVYIEIDG